MVPIVKNWNQTKSHSKEWLFYFVIENITFLLHLKIKVSINAIILLKEENQVLIVHKLNTIEKIRKFFDWIRQNLKDGNLKVTEEEIVRVVVQIGEGIL